jgi:murein DD-endopeptidase MepM/ murein hydrolase activator NlpD
MATQTLIPSNQVNPNPAQRLLSPYAKISIGKNSFVSGDGYLQSCSVTLSEGANASVCQFVIYDPGRKFTDFYLTYIEDHGLQAPDIAGSSPGETYYPGQTPYSGKFPSINGVDPNRIQDAYNYMLSIGLTPLGASYMVGDFIQESALNPRSGIGTASAIGLAQWEGARQEGMPTDLHEQIKWAIDTEMGRDGAAADLPNLLRSPTATADQIKNGIQQWERYGIAGNRYVYGEQIYSAVQNSAKNQSSTAVQQAAQKPVVRDAPAVVESNTGSQITVELGYSGQAIAQYSFLHTGIEFDLLAPDKLTISGTSANWVMTQVARSTAYQNLTFKQIAQMICNEHGLELDMADDGPTYNFFPQRGISDYDMLLMEARRLGYRVYCVGKRLTIQKRQAKDSGFTLIFRENMGDTFTVSYEAQKADDTGSRADSPSNQTTVGQRKFKIDPDTGITKQLTSESSGAEKAKDSIGTAKKATTGSQIPQLEPITNDPTIRTENDQEQEMRLYGIKAQFSCPAYPECLTLAPDSIFRVQGVSKFIDRVWVVDSITHTWDGATFKTSGNLYTPIKAPIVLPGVSNIPSGAAAGVKTNPGHLIDPTNGVATLFSSFGEFRGDHYHQGVDLDAPEGTPVFASADGVVVDHQDGCQVGDEKCGGGFGNFVKIRHNDGTVTIYGHMHPGSIAVTDNQQVKQGQQIGGIGSTGHSDGPHLHFEVHPNGGPAVDPLNYIKVKNP